jgi:hypothetical protein
MSDSDHQPQPAFEHSLSRIAGRLRVLTVVVAVLALAVFLLMAVQYGSLVNYWGGDALFFGGTSAGAALVGFGLGFLVGRWR